MTEERIFPWFLRKDYDIFKRLSQNDSGLPDTFEEWREFAEKQIAEYEANGIAIKKVVIHPHEFAGYCDATGLNRNRVARDAFAVKANRHDSQG